MKVAHRVFDHNIGRTTYMQFLRQIGVTHIIGSMPDVSILPSAKEGYWSEDDLCRWVKHINENGLKVEAIENFIPRHWYKILMDLPGKEQQMENIKRTIRAMGKAKIPIMGYNFSAGGVYGQAMVYEGRGEAKIMVFDPERYPYDDTPIPKSMAWGMVVDPEAEGRHGLISREEMKGRLHAFLEEILPVAEEANVVMAVHPEDPPVSMIRQAGRVLISPQDFDELFARFDTPYCAMEFCQGTFTEMPYDIYESIEHFAKSGRIAYAHVRNVNGKVPSYREALLDEGDVDIPRALKLYDQHGFKGAVIPDHYPKLVDIEGEHASVAYSIAYLRAAMKFSQIPIE
ncbi:mannonate dehydratase [Paenibacillus roseipurpureus]|uniref:mannonate dehydratase n=1 Tax=Paenibacillus roseopurpureus TaxID=2918901 RepID=A0AA96LLU1_9BACL|nr:mannonate dehydratase [Paenibacillus sp. MBLB1832]WNR42971.1 mannonate dehydratase [Paenibacillus sp. MBLB1832]